MAGSTRTKGKKKNRGWAKGGGGKASGPGLRRILTSARTAVARLLPLTPRTRVIAAGLTLLVLVGLAYSAQSIIGTAWAAVVDYQSRYTFALTPAPSTRQPATGGVVLVVVDGLRLDTSRQLVAFNQARNGASGQPAGADFAVVTGQPSLSSPGAAVILSGTTPDIHGVTTNWYEGPIKIDDLLKAVNRSGRTAALIGGQGWVQLFADSSATLYTKDEAAEDYDRQVFEQAMTVLDAAATPPDLTVVHFGGLDTASHEFGATSPEALAAAQTIDGYLTELLSAYDLSQRTVILTSDHGHIDTGGHGGSEAVVATVPLVMAGKGIVPGSTGEGRQEDIAPTIAALLGTEIPTHCTGTILTGAVGLTPEEMTRALTELAELRYEFSKNYALAAVRDMIKGPALPRAIATMYSGKEQADSAVSKLASGQTDEAYANATRGLALINQGREDVKQAQTQADTGKRTPRAITVALGGLLLLLYLARNRWLPWAALGAVLYFAVYNFLYFLAHGLWWSLSVLNEGMVEAFFLNRMLEAAGITLLLAIGLGLVAGRRKYEGPELAQGVATFGFGVVYLLGLQVLVFYVPNGVHFTWFIPDLTRGFKFYADLAQMVAVGVASVLAVPLALAAAKLGAKLRA